MRTLQETLLAPDIKSQVIADCENLVNHEVAVMAGVTGTAVRLAYKTVRGSAVKHVKAALPALGVLVQKYMAQGPAFHAARTACP